LAIVRFTVENFQQQSFGSLLILLNQAAPPIGQLGVHHRGNPDLRVD
jgi:hypothetical protein